MTMQLANLNRETFQINENNCTIGTVIKKKSHVLKKTSFADISANGKQ